MMEAVRTSETPVYFDETTRQNIPEGCHLTFLNLFQFKGSVYTVLKHHFVFGMPEDQISDRILAILTETSRGFPQPLKGNARIVP
jgi:hypothetical protein